VAHSRLREINPQHYVPSLLWLPKWDALLPLRAKGLPLAASSAAAVGAIPNHEPQPVNRLLAVSTAAAAPGRGTAPEESCSKPCGCSTAQHSTAWLAHHDTAPRTLFLDNNLTLYTTVLDNLRPQEAQSLMS
jgi:hypothetical protein